MKKFSFVKYSIAFTFGIFLQFYFHLSNIFILSFLLLNFLILFYSLLKNYSKNFKAISGLIIFFLFGALWYQYSNINVFKYPFKEYKLKDIGLFGKVDGIKLLKQNKLTLEVKLDSIKCQSLTEDKKIKFICNIYESSKNLEDIYNQIKIGNEIFVKANVLKPRDKRNPFEFDYEKYLNEKGIYFIANVYKKENLKIIDKTKSILSNFIFEVRKSIDNQLKRIYNKSTYNLLKGLILADRSEIDDEINEDFINVGVIHVLAVSGLHVGFIVVIFLFLFNRFNLTIRILFTIFGLLFFMFLTGSGAPVVRATLMISIVLLLPLFGRSSNALNSLFVASFIILLINPKELFNPSFQLSFSAILSLLIFSPIINSKIHELRINNFNKSLLLLVGTTLSAQIGTLPFTIAYFGKISLVSFIANIFIIPLVGIIISLGIASLFFSFLIYHISIYYSSLNEVISFLMLFIINKISSISFSSINVKPFTLYDGILFYTIIGLILSLTKYFNNKIKKIIFIGSVVIIFFTYERIDDFSLLPQNELSILAIDIGQGDSFLIKFPNNQTALIDAGNADKNFDNGKKVIIPLLRKLDINKINYAFVSHVDADHFMGFLSLIKNGIIEKVYKPELISGEKKDLSFEKFIRKNGTEIIYYKKEKIKIGNASIYILNNKLINNFSNSINDQSGILKLVYGKNSFLFTGDLGVKMEKLYVSGYKTFLKSDLLKAGHHGSKTSSSEIFVNSVKPKYALISVGIGNKFRHPNKEVLKRFKENGIKILRTDLSGAILINSNGEKISLINWKKL